MELITEFFLEIIVGRLIIGFFGYYTLYIIYKLFGNRQGIEWLQETVKSEETEIEKGCLVGITGFISFGIFLYLIIIIADFISSI